MFLYVTQSFSLALALEYDVRILSISDWFDFSRSFLAVYCSTEYWIWIYFGWISSSELLFGLNKEWSDSLVFAYSFEIRSELRDFHARSHRLCNADSCVLFVGCDALINSYLFSASNQATSVLDYNILWRNSIDAYLRFRKWTDSFVVVSTRNGDVLNKYDFVTKILPLL